MGRFLILSLMLYGCSTFDKGTYEIKTQKKNCHESKNNDLAKAVENKKFEENKHIIFHNLAKCLSLEKQYRESIYYYEIALTSKQLTKKNHSLILNNLSNNYFMTDNIDLGITMLEQSLKIDPNNQKAIEKMGFIQFSNGNFQLSLKLLNRISNPTDLVLYYMGANSYFLGDSKSLNNILLKISDKNSDSFKILKNASEYIQNKKTNPNKEAIRTLIVDSAPLKAIQQLIGETDEKENLLH